MTVVYVLWLHDMILGIYGSWSKALRAAKVYRDQPHYRGLPWKRIGGSRQRVRWFTDDRRPIKHTHTDMAWSQMLTGRSVSRLEVEQWPVL
jgi:hypothetical protein